MADEGVRGALEQIGGAADLDRPPLGQHHHAVGEGQGLGLVVRHVDQRELEFLMDLLELEPQQPFQVGVDHGEWLIEQDRRDVASYQSSAERDLLLGVGRKPARAPLEVGSELEQLRHLAHPRLHLRLADAAVAQRKGEVVEHGHRVVDHGELEDLCDVSLCGRQPGDVAPVEEDATLARSNQTRDDVQQRRLARTRRTEQSVGAAVMPVQVRRLKRVVLRRGRGRLVAVANSLELDARHQLAPALSIGRAGAAARFPAPSKTNSRFESKCRLTDSPRANSRTPSSCAIIVKSWCRACT